ncbi:Ig-like domain-containing protein [Actinoplanes regularis]|uniref:Ig-like domain-containing protein n=1 Tax=Actinoplanes regularis TaxID=52697 RepID=UPI0024A5E145|nr:Ig-like domain-containing protein [Actinoplanes regularis]GLW35253.1 hypothetical protein Areg01_81890 [Actinoplanes regularis]
MARLRRSTIAVIAGSLTLAAATPAHADDPVPDTTAPVIVSTGLTPGQLVGLSTAFGPLITDTGLIEVQILVNGVLKSRFKAVDQFNQPVKLHASGLPNDTDIDVTIRALDAAGNLAEATTRVHLDAKLPTAVPIPAIGTVLHPGPVTITLTSLPDDLTKVTFYGNEQPEVRTEGPWTFTWNATEEGFGPYFELRDKAGNYGDIYPRYLVDESAPVISDLTYQPPYDGVRTIGTDGALIGATARLGITVTDKSPVNTTEWRVDGVLRSYESGYLDLTPDMTTGTSAVIEYRAVDKLGHEARKSFPVTIDRTGPAISSMTPANGAFVRGSSFRTTITASDPNGIGYTSVAGIANSNSVAIPIGTDRQYAFTWLLIDRLGNRTSVQRVVTADNTLPTVAFSKAPANGAKLTKTTAITASASDRNGIARVQLLVNGVQVANDARAPYTFTLDPKKYGKTFTVRLRAYDRAGNIRYTSQRTYHR